MNVRRKGGRQRHRIDREVLGHEVACAQRPLAARALEALLQVDGRKRQSLSARRTGTFGQRWVGVRQGRLLLDRPDYRRLGSLVQRRLVVGLFSGSSLAGSW